MHVFTRNITLEKYAIETHVPRFVIEEDYESYPDVSRGIVELWAIRLDQDNVPLSPTRRYEWDGESKDRK